MSIFLLGFWYGQKLSHQDGYNIGNIFSVSKKVFIDVNNTWS